MWSMRDGHARVLRKRESCRQMKMEQGADKTTEIFEYL